MLLQLWDSPAIPNAQKWSGKPAFQLSLGHREKIEWKQLFALEGLILEHFEAVHSRFLLLVPCKAHSRDWMKAREGARGLIISIFLSVITNHPYCITSVPNISKNK